MFYLKYISRRQPFEFNVRTIFNRNYFWLNHSYSLHNITLWQHCIEQFTYSKQCVEFAQRKENSTKVLFCTDYCKFAGLIKYCKFARWVDSTIWRDYTIRRGEGLIKKIHNQFDFFHLFYIFKNIQRYTVVCPKFAQAVQSSYVFLSS